MLQDFSSIIDYAIKIYCDNQSAIAVASTDNIKRLKHIDIRYHYIKELVKSGKIYLEYIKTEEQIGDLFTKPLSRDLVVKFARSLGIM